jgi:vitamin B12 transporter
LPPAGRPALSTTRWASDAGAKRRLQRPDHRGQNPDADGYKSLGANAKLGFQINPDHRIEANVLQSHTDSQYDGGLTRDFRRISDLQTLGLQWEAKWSDRYSTKLALTQGTDSGEEA